MHTVSGLLADVWKKEIYPAEISFENGVITGILELEATTGAGLPYILPGFTDAHVHIESSMLAPSEFARLAVLHGTVATVSDPHEIANVCGLEGVEFMIKNGAQTPFKFNFGAPSCVPATVFETAGAALDAAAVEELLKKEEIKYLSEMMNFPGVLHQDPEVMAKIAAAQKLGKPVDGHAPGLRGAEAEQYIAAGISTDHECFTAEEALDKLKHGMKIIVREGSAARNFDALAPLLHEHSDMMMFCSDDKHPDSLVESHINALCARAVALGIDVFKVLQAACVNPVLHYKLNVGLLRQGDPADFILVKDLKDFEVTHTYINGILVAELGETKIPGTAIQPINRFDCAPRSIEEFSIPYNNEKEIWVIEALDGQLITHKLAVPAEDFYQYRGTLESNVENDLLKMVVVNRYHPAPVAKAWVKNFGLKEGAIASSVAHDSHNIIAVGVDDESLCQAINLVIEKEGGVSCASETLEMVVALPIAGLMSGEDGFKVAEQYASIDAAAKSLGSTLRAPFMTLSFMALLVIPHLKLSDKGLFDGDGFCLVE